MTSLRTFRDGTIHLFCGDTLEFYDEWESPTVIISDGPYGVNGFPGDLVTPNGLDTWYEPHIKKWSELATPLTTLWFWNTEVGWASVHPTLEKYGWDYVSCCIWDKGLSHIAGNTNTKTIRHLPVVTEVCVQYVKKPVFQVGHKKMSMKEWLRYEWLRTGIPLSKTNEACEVKDAATRKYFTQSHLWYMPPADAFEKIAEYANMHGNPYGRPYFSLNGKTAISREEWAQMRSKFYCPIGVTNVWQVPQLRNGERIKLNQKAVHLNQKPLLLIKRTIEMSSDRNDIVWDPFAGLFTTAVASCELNRRCYSSEINREVYSHGIARVEQWLKNDMQRLF